jgi:hypothetical protein
MSLIRSALIDLKEAASLDADILAFIDPRSEDRPAIIAAKPNALDPHTGGVIDTTKWEPVGTVVQQDFVGIRGLSITGPATPAWDVAGVIYKPAIAAQVGRVVFARAVLDHSAEYIFSLQEYAFTVDSVATPTTWDLKYTTTPQDLRNSIGLRYSLGSLYFFEGGEAGTEELVSELPARSSLVDNVFPIQVAFVFTAAGWDIYAHLPGIWTSPKLVKQYVRPGSVHAADGYSFCTNVYTADSFLHFYNLAYYFLNGVLVSGAKIITANKSDRVMIGSMIVGNQIGVNANQNGQVYVRIPDLSSTAYTLEQLAEITTFLTSKQVYDVEFELSGDAAILHPIRISIDDVTLEAQITPVPEEN